jgi:HAD superfamily hydrolase (TIGR01484 family)
MTLAPLDKISQDEFANVRVVLTDIDDTLTLHGRLPACAYEALEKLHDAGFHVVPITGRPAGWCDHIARMWPVDAVVGENGAFYFQYDSADKKMRRVYAQSQTERKHNAEVLQKIAADILLKYPGTAIAADQAYREIDVAIDFAEDVKPLSLFVAQQIADEFAVRGATAKVSSIHVNAWIGAHDKLTMSLRMLKELFDIDGLFNSEKIAYVGDSPNDAPMFGHFPLSVGVANIKPFANLMQHLPRYVTRGEGGQGFAEFAEKIMTSTVI